MYPSEIKAKSVADIIIKAARNYADAHKYFGRKFDDLFENGDGEHVVVEFIKLYKTNNQLQEASKKVDHWLNIDNWLKTYERWEQRNPTLF